MVTPILRPSATCTIDETTVKVREGSIKLDAFAVRYGSADLEIPLLDLEQIELLDPRGNKRVVLQAGFDGDTPREFNFHLRERQVDHKQKVINLKASTDEALLEDYAPIADDSTPRTYASNLRNLVGYVLDKAIPGAVLEAGTTTADLTPAWTLINQFTNPAVVGNVAGYLTGSGSTTIAYNSGTGSSGTAGFLRASQSAASGAVYLAPSSTGGPTVTPGKSYCVSADVRVSTSTSQIFITLRWQDANGATIANSAASATTVGTSWTRISHMAVAPAGAVRCTPYVQIASTASGRTWDIDSALFVEDTEIPPYFSGGSTADSLYTYGWSADSNGSQSTRTPIVDRPRELFTWKAGQSAWDFLEPLTAQANLKLFCDEQRRWWLIDPAEYAVDGNITVSTGYNAIEGSDSISREDPDLYATNVIVTHRWTDANGTEQIKVDAAGEPGKSFNVELNTPYTGGGIAQNILNRRLGQGRTQAVTTLSNYETTPGMEASISLPGTVDQTGEIESVQWGLTTGLMEIGTKGLTDSPPDSWLGWDADEEWDDLSDSVLWNNI